MNEARIGGGQFQKRGKTNGFKMTLYEDEFMWRKIKERKAAWIVKYRHLVKRCGAR